MAKDNLRVNRKIKLTQAMVVDERGTQLGLLPIPEAITLAGERGLDLVEVAPNAKPPVCRFMDYGKFKYRKNKRAHEAKKHQKLMRLKEIKITPRTSEHDYKFKLKHTIRFLTEGNKAKVTVFFKGRQITHAELGRVMLDRFVEDTKEFAVVSQEPKLEGRRMSMILEPTKKTRQAAHAPVKEKPVEEQEAVTQAKEEVEGEPDAKD